MLVSLANEPGDPNKPNEDWVGATSNVAIVLDGLSEGAETGCIHGTPWYVRQLGTHLLQLAGEPDVPLAECLAGAIIRVRESHRETCDLSHPGSPCSTVAIFRERSSMSLAKAVGIDAPDVRLVHRDELVGLPSNMWPNNEEWAYAVRRFDRDDKRGLVHIEDLAQVRDIYPSDKYLGSYGVVFE